MENEKVNIAVNAVQTSLFGLFNKKIHYEIVDGNRTDYKYSIADLVYYLIDREVSKHDIWEIICEIEKGFKVK